ncbi:MAG TPA: hypothetical protein VMV93_14915, partial [Chloroflexota bacterium]|nr:hypothetical protein [Chloroflexota bacterium]
SILGPIIGAVGLRWVSDILSRASTQSSLFLGAVLMVVVYFMPDGIFGVLDHLAALLAGRPPEDLSPPTSSAGVDQPAASAGTVG